MMSHVTPRDMKSNDHFERLTIDGACQITVAHMAVAVMPVQARKQQRGVPGHQPG